MKTIGIVAHGAEGAALCFITACREGTAQLGPHMHPDIVMSALPMGLSMAAWEANDQAAVAKFLAKGVQQVCDAGADFYVCPNNTAHIALEQVAGELPLPGLHIAEVVCHEVIRHGWKRVGLLGTRWTMTGPVYERSLNERGLERLIPDEPMREQLNAAILDELCLGIFKASTTDLFLGAIEDLKSQRRRVRNSRLHGDTADRNARKLAAAAAGFNATTREVCRPRGDKRATFRD